MHSDPSGHFIISLGAFLFGIAIGAVAGAAVSFSATVYDDYADDGEIFNGSISADEYVGNTIGGLVAGAGVGACSVLGAGLGAAMAAGETLAVGGVAMSGLSALGIGASSAFASGCVGYSVKTAINSEESFEVSDMLIEGGANLFSGMLSFSGGLAGGITGVNVPGVKKGIGNFAKYHIGLTYFGVYPMKAFGSKIKNYAKGIF